MVRIVGDGLLIDQAHLHPTAKLKPPSPHLSLSLSLSFAPHGDSDLGVDYNLFTPPILVPPPRPRAPGPSRRGPEDRPDVRTRFSSFALPEDLPSPFALEVGTDPRSHCRSHELGTSTEPRRRLDHIAGPIDREINRARRSGVRPRTFLPQHHSPRLSAQNERDEPNHEAASLSIDTCRKGQISRDGSPSKSGSTAAF